MEKLKHILESQQFSREWLENEFFPLAAEMEKIVKEQGVWTFCKYFFKRRILSGKRMVSFFYEPSTGTQMSFEMAMDRLGGKVVYSSDHAGETSSVAKGESIQDTIRRVSAFYPDVIVLRTPEEGMANKAAEFSSVPIINAGDGKGQHPTQAKTDLFTIKKEKGEIEGQHIVITGDLIRGRTARSLAYLAAKYPGVKMTFVSPEMARISQDVKDYLKKHGVPFEEIYDIREAASSGDVFYITRIQRERGGDILFNYGKPSFWKMNQEVLNLMKKDAIVMHPLPHLDEIAPEVDKDPRAVYFRQSENKLYIAMADLKIILG